MTLPGWFSAMIGGVLVATFAGLIGSAIALAPDLLSDGLQTRDVVAIGSGAFVLPFALSGWPLLLPIWIALISTAHILASKGRQTRQPMSPRRQTWHKDIRSHVEPLFQIAHNCTLSGWKAASTLAPASNRASRAQPTGFWN